LLNLFYTYWPELIRQGKIYRVLSPLIIAKRKTTKEKETFYSLQEFIEKQDEYDIIEYNKGLGSLSKEEYAKLVNNPTLIQFSESDYTEEKLDLIFGKSNQDKRKIWLNADEENEE
jgi:DNA gyrase/topoisomerase IV subunit B